MGSNNSYKEYGMSLAYGKAIYEIVEEALNYFNHLNLDELKRADRKLKEDSKLLAKGKSRLFFISQFCKQDELMKYMDITSRVFKLKFEYTKNSREYYTHNTEFCLACGFYSDNEAKQYVIDNKVKRVPNQTPEQLDLFVSEVYPVLDINLWQLQFEIEVIQQLIRKLTPRD